MGAAEEIRRGTAPDLEDLELELLLEALVRRFGFDYRLHERAPLKRKLFARMQEDGLRTLSQLQDQVLHDADAADALVRALSVAPMALFDDPAQALLWRSAAEQTLHGCALPRIWLADCAGVGQAWTLAILLDELGLAGRAEIFATVASDKLQAQAEGASIAAAELHLRQPLYVQAGGQAALADYFTLQGNRAVLAPRLRSRISWAQYNLVTDASFNEFQMIVCQQALPDFGPLLRQRVLNLFHDSLAPFGVLGIDRPLSDDDSLAACYAPLLPPHPWHKRIA
jgi:chemotaxis protein methyltransferase CheR